MARMETTGLDSLMNDLNAVAERTPELRDKILNAEADVIEPALSRSISDERLVRSSKLKLSLSRRKVKISRLVAIRIGPTGEHHRYFPSSGKSGIVNAGYVGYIGEYGIPVRGIKGREWLKKGLTKSQNNAFDAAETVFNEFMDKNNL